MQFRDRSDKSFFVRQAAFSCERKMIRARLSTVEHDRKITQARSDAVFQRIQFKCRNSVDEGLVLGCAAHEYEKEFLNFRNKQQAKFTRFQQKQRPKPTAESMGFALRGCQQNSEDVSEGIQKR